MLKPLKSCSEWVSEGNETWLRRGRSLPLTDCQGSCAFAHINQFGINLKGTEMPGAALEPLKFSHPSSIKEPHLLLEIFPSVERPLFSFVKELSQLFPPFLPSCVRSIIFAGEKVSHSSEDWHWVNSPVFKWKPCPVSYQWRLKSNARFCLWARLRFEGTSLYHLLILTGDQCKVRMGGIAEGTDIFLLSSLAICIAEIISAKLMTWIDVLETVSDASPNFPEPFKKTGLNGFFNIFLSHK